jgi:hypothetical protein
MLRCLVEIMSKFCVSHFIAKSIVDMIKPDIGVGKRKVAGIYPLFLRQISWFNEEIIRSAEY